MAVDQPCFDQQLQVTRHTRLRLAKDGHEFGDGHFGFRQKRKNAQARGLARRFERGKQDIKRLVARMGGADHRQEILTGYRIAENDIKICLCDFSDESKDLPQRETERAAGEDRGLRSAYPMARSLRNTWPGRAAIKRSGGFPAS